MEVSKTSFVSLLQSKDCKKFGKNGNNEIWLSPDKFIIRFPDSKNIHIDIIEIICLDILNMGIWDYDYWLGQNCIN